MHFACNIYIYINIIQKVRKANHHDFTKNEYFRLTSCKCQQKQSLALHLYFKQKHLLLKLNIIKTN